MMNCCNSSDRSGQEAFGLVDEENMLDKEDRAWPILLL